MRTKSAAKVQKKTNIRKQNGDFFRKTVFSEHSRVLIAAQVFYLAWRKFAYVEKKQYLCSKNTMRPMKRVLFLMVLFAACCCGAVAQKTWAQHERYAAQNDSINADEIGENRKKKKRPTAVLMGNSITDGWASKHPEFFAENNFVGRGISGQVTAQMLSRFQADVVALNPKMVIIMAGTNDIAMNNGYIAHEQILQNIQSMCELAKYNKIKPVLCSVLPAAAFKWRPNLTPAEDIKHLNEMIEAYAKANKIKYIDYYSALVDEHGGLPKKYAADGVHPNLEAYQIMEAILLENL